MVNNLSMNLIEQLYLKQVDVNKNKNLRLDTFHEGEKIDEEAVSRILEEAR